MAKKKHPDEPIIKRMTPYQKGFFDCRKAVTNLMETEKGPYTRKQWIDLIEKLMPKGEHT